MKNVSFYLIHNNSEDRINLRENLKNLSSKLNIDLFEIHKQKNSLKSNLSLIDKFLIIRIYFLRIYYNFKHKNEFSFEFFYLLFKSFLKLNKSIIKLFLEDNKKVMNIYHHIKIEQIVTGKHIKAWQHFLKSKKEIMVIFEDDAICEHNTESRLRDFFIRLDNINMDNFFIDLAGGCNLNDVIPKRKFKKSKDEFILIKGIYTNTACSYLINRNLIKKFYSEYNKSNLNNYFPIDHLINKLGLKINKANNIFSIHFHNPLFTHGSFKGNIKSWQIY